MKLNKILFSGVLSLFSLSLGSTLTADYYNPAYYESGMQPDGYNYEAYGDYPSYNFDESEYLGYWGYPYSYGYTYPYDYDYPYNYYYYNDYPYYYYGYPYYYSHPSYYGYPYHHGFYGRGYHGFREHGFYGYGFGGHRGHR